MRGPNRVAAGRIHASDPTTDRIGLFHQSGGWRWESASVFDGHKICVSYCFSLKISGRHSHHHHKASSNSNFGRWWPKLYTYDIIIIKSLLISPTTAHGPPDRRSYLLESCHHQYIYYNYSLQDVSKEVLSTYTSSHTTPAVGVFLMKPDNTRGQAKFGIKLQAERLSE